MNVIDKAVDQNFVRGRRQDEGMKAVSEWAAQHGKGLLQSFADEGNIDSFAHTFVMSSVGVDGGVDLVRRMHPKSSDHYLRSAYVHLDFVHRKVSGDWVTMGAHVFSIEANALLTIATMNVPKDCTETQISMPGTKTCYSDGFTLVAAAFVKGNALLPM
ncbi:hypothetical protein CYMTET_54862 [Cymbomonas tetramitiformis]|uniref:Uncharacterized protein n=1 Tax=Cymbomonas tetramitiformis TaxID=36881 RepID=A0AAE0ENX7_9CHLO|nr:hypothetical protein CYMTET_54862 [Cymbomonas tetramitiformis]